MLCNVLCIQLHLHNCACWRIIMIEEARMIHWGFGSCRSTSSRVESSRGRVEIRRSSTITSDNTRLAKIAVRNVIHMPEHASAIRTPSRSTKIRTMSTMCKKEVDLSFSLACKCPRLDGGQNVSSSVRPSVRKKGFIIQCIIIIHGAHKHGMRVSEWVIVQPAKWFPSRQTRHTQIASRTKQICMHV